MSAEDRVETDRKRHAAWARFAKETGDTPALPAATVVVLRDGPEGPETLMLRKNSKIAFGGMWVFPGGKVDVGDWDGADEDVDAARNAAIREAAEEAHLRVEAHEMVVFAYWIPPAIAPKRYATWFFAARVDDDDVIIDDGEIVEMSWATPAAVLAKHHDGEIEIVPPTWVTLNTLTGHDTVVSLLEFLDERPARHHATKVASGGDFPVVMWQGDAGYDTGDATVAGPRHRLTMATDGYVYEDDGVSA
jgi:8-oxo-dGTP pyrophosphatase MutT (NUDIX family)